jgi:tetratricopeptide (TPR) repeat protein
MADAALSLDPSQAEAYAARAYVLRYLWAPFEEVASDLRQALRLEPNSGDTHGWYGHLLAREGRFEESMAEHEKSVELDPLALGRRVGFSWDALAGREYEIALREAERGLALAPSLADPQAAKAASLLMLRRPELCAELDLGPYEGVRAMCLHAEGKLAEASALVDSIRVLIDSDSFPDSVFGSAIPAASIATYYAWVGEGVESLEWFERAFAMSPETHFYRIFQSGLFDNVRDDAAFWAGVERLRNGLRARLSEES